MPGASIHSRRFLDMLLRSGHSVVLVDAFDPFPDGRANYSFIPYPKARAKWLKWGGLKRHLHPWIIAAQLRTIWRRIKPDVVHVHWLDSRAYHCALANIHPLVLTCWGSDINNFFSPDSNDSSLKKRVSKALRAAEHVTADTPEIIERCKQLAGRNVRASLYYYGIDMGAFSHRSEKEVLDYKKSLGIPAQSRVLLSVRALRPLMGHHRVLEAFAKAVGFPEMRDIVLVFKRYLAFDDGYEKELKDRARQLSLENRVFWIDPPQDEDMPLLYGLADLVINVPERDGFPVTFFEAAACHRPMLMSDLPAYSGVITGNECWLVPSFDIDMMAEALRMFFSSPAEEIHQRVDRASMIVHSIGSQDASLSAMEAVYRAFFRRNTEL